MLPSVLIFAGSIVGIGSMASLYLKWRGHLRQSWIVAAAWTGIASSIVLWSTAYEPDVGVPFAVMLMTLVAMGLVLKGVDLRTVAQFPDTRLPDIRRSASETTVQISWPSVAARSLSAVVAAPMVGMTLGLLMWTWLPGHEADRLISAVVVFLAAFATLQVWGLSATRPWRALCLIVLLGVAAAIPVAMGL